MYLNVPGECVTVCATGLCVSSVCAIQRMDRYKCLTANRAYVEIADADVIRAEEGGGGSSSEAGHQVAVERAQQRHDGQIEESKAGQLSRGRGKEGGRERQQGLHRPVHALPFTSQHLPRGTQALLSQRGRPGAGRGEDE